MRVTEPGASVPPDRGPRRKLRTLLLALALVAAAIYHYRAKPPSSTKAPVASASATSAPRATPSAPKLQPRSIALIPARHEKDPKAENGAFEARVVARATGAPIAGAVVTLAQGDVADDAIADERGEIVWTPKGPAPADVTSVSAKGFDRLEPPRGSMTWVPRAGERVRGITIALDAAESCEGVVHDDAKVPIPTALVRVLSEDGDKREEVVADAEGHFAIAHPRDGTVEVRKLGFVTKRVGEVGWRRGDCKLTVVLARGRAHGTIRGRVVSADAPPHGMAVRAYADGGDARFGAPAIAEVGADGAFALTELDESTTYRLVARHPAVGAGEARGVTTGRDDVVIPLARGAHVTGLVRDKRGGAPIASFSIELVRANGPLERQAIATRRIFDATGAFDIPDVAPGDYELRVAAAGWAPNDRARARVEGDASPSPLAIDLDRGGRVFGEVTDRATKKPLEGALVVAEGAFGAGSIAESAISDARGKFEIGGISKTLTTLEVEAAGHDGRIVSGLVVDASGDVGPVAIDLAPVAPGEEPKVELVGIGAVLAAKDDALVIGGVMEGGGAADAGLVKGDSLLAVDGALVTELGFETAIQRIRGPEGSTVVLVVRKAAGGEPITLSVVRRKIRG